MAEGVKIYGAFDIGVLARGGSDDAVQAARGTHTVVSSGMNGHNFIGFQVSEDLGNGMKLTGDAQFDFLMDSAEPGNLGSGLRARTTTLALSGDFGTVVAGRTGGARAAWIKKYDPFGGFGVGGQLSTTGIGIGEDYANNVVAWVTPEILPGLKGLAAYTTDLDNQDQVAGANRAGPGRLYAFAAMYDNGPLSFVLNYENLEFKEAGSALARGKAQGNPEIFTAGASYDFGVAKVHGLYDNIVEYGNGWQAGVSAPVGEATTLKAGYSTGETRGYLSPALGRGECSKWAIGVNHELSKRTRLYADYARLADAERSTCAITTYGGTHGSVFGSDGHRAGYGEWGMNVGVRHSF